MSERYLVRYVDQEFVAYEGNRRTVFTRQVPVLGPTEETYILGPEVSNGWIGFWPAERRTTDSGEGA